MFIIAIDVVVDETMSTERRLEVTTTSEWSQSSRDVSVLSDSGENTSSAALSDNDLEQLTHAFGNNMHFISADDESANYCMSQCGICYEPDLQNVLRCCRGVVCNSCISQHVATQLLGNGRLQIPCPFTNCTSMLDVDLVRHFLSDSDDDLLSKYNRWIVAIDNQSPHCKTCPRCCRVTEVDPVSLKSSGKKYGLVVDCVDCGLEWCFQCQSPSHDGVTCRQYRQEEVKLDCWARQRRQDGGRNAQRCPKCKVISNQHTCANAVHA